MDHEKVIKNVVKRFLMMGLKDESFETLSDIIHSCDVISKSVSTAAVTFDEKKRRFIIMWDPTFVEKMNEEFHSNEALEDFFFLVIWHEVLHISLGHLAIDEKGFLERYSQYKLTHRDLNIIGDVQINTIILRNNTCQHDISYYARREFEKYQNSYTTFGISLQQSGVEKRSFYSWAAEYVEKNKQKDQNGGSGGEEDETLDDCDFGSMKESDLGTAAVGQILQKQEEGDFAEEMSNSGENKRSSVKSTKPGDGGGNSEHIVHVKDISIKFPPLMKDYFNLNVSDTYRYGIHKVEQIYATGSIPAHVKLPIDNVEEKKKDICFFCDTSGSMSNNLLCYVMPIVTKEVSRLVNSIVMVYCDTKITRKFTYKNPEDLNPYSGGGGTGFRGPFYELYDKYGIRDIVCYTDGYFQEFPLPEGMTVIWLLVDEGDTKMPGHKIYIQGAH